MRLTRGKCCLVGVEDCVWMMLLCIYIIHFIYLFNTQFISIPKIINLHPATWGLLDPRSPLPFYNSYVYYDIVISSRNSFRVHIPYMATKFSKKNSRGRMTLWGQVNTIRCWQPLVTVRLLTKRKLIIAVCYKETENLKYCYENNSLMFEVVTLKSLGLEVTDMRK